MVKGIPLFIVDVCLIGPSAFFGRTLQAGLADRGEHVSNFSHRVVRNKEQSGRRILFRNFDRYVACKRVGPIRCPPVFIAFANGAGLL